jgi:hypothetical protein
VIPTCNGAVTGDGTVHAREIAFDTANNDVYVATDCGVAISRDAGATWSHAGPPSGTALDAESSVTVQQGGIVTICGDDGLHRSVDAGVTWDWTGGIDPRPAARRFGFVCERQGYHGLSGSPVETDVVYVTVREWDDATPPAPTAMLYEVAFTPGTDDLASAVRLNTPQDNNRSPVVRARRTPFAALTVYSVWYSNGVCTYVQHCDSAAGRCDPNESSWTQLTMDHKDASEFAFGTGDCPLAMSNDGGVLVTSDCGSNWTWPALDGLDALQLYDVEVQAYDDGMGGHDHTDIYVSTMDNGVHASSDSGVSFPHRGPGGEGLHIEVPRTPPAHDDQIVSYTACADCIGKVGEEHLVNTVDWTAPTGTNEPARGFPGQLVIDHNAFVTVRENKICSGTTNACADNSDCATGVNCVNVDHEMYLLEGLGTSWVNRLTFGRRPRNARMQFSGPLSNPVLFMGVDGASSASLGLERIDNIRSGTPAITAADSGINLGMHWQGQGCFDCPKPTFAAEPTTPAQLIAVDNNGDLFKSPDAGASWTIDAASTAAIAAGYDKNKCFPDPSGNLRCEPNIRVVEYDPASPSDVFVGLETGGVFYSDDAGANWEWVTGSDQITAVTAFAFDQVTGDVYVSSYGRGLWRLRKVDLMLPAPDPYEPNDVSGESADLDLTHTRHWSGLVAEDYSLESSDFEQWTGGLTGLTLHDRSDVDRFSITLQNIAAHVPDLPDGPSPDDPMPFCGDITREPGPRPFYAGTEPDTVMFRSWVEVTTSGLGNDEVLTANIPSTGTNTRRYIACPGRLRRTGFTAIVGDRTGLGTERTVFPTYGLGVEYRVDVTRISAAAEWLKRKLQPVRDSEMVFPIPCPGGVFPNCPSISGGPVQVDIDHPLLPDCKADGPGCRMFSPFTWARDQLFELTFTSAIDQSYELWNEQGQRVAQAAPQLQEGVAITKVLSADIPPGFYVLVITGQPAQLTITWPEWPPSPDTDNDGFPDALDACPNEPEDYDGDRDGDGCKDEPGDVDGDGILDTADNCRDVRDPQQFDSDNDGRGDVCDCDIDNPLVWAPPSEIPDLNFKSKWEMEWSPTGGGSGTVYELLRSSLDDVPVTADGSDLCLVGNYTGTSWQEGATPQSGGFHYLVRGRNSCGVGSLGGSRGSSADCSSQMCAHSKCVAGTNLFAGCDDCVAQVCAADPYCCDTSWDSICVGRVLDDCGLATCPDNGASCAHEVCETGAPLVAGCDDGGMACVASVCDLDPYCCQKEWDDDCTVTLEAACGATCE